MRCLRFALTGMVLLLCLLGSCSFGEKALEEVVVAEDEEAEEEKEKTEPAEKEAEDEEDEEEEEELPPDNPPAAVFLGWKAVSGDTVVFEFSQPVTVAELDFAPDLEIAEVLEEDCTVTVLFEEDLAPGLRVEARLSVEDEYGNTVDVQETFRSRNNRVPEMLITELRTENDKLKAEFIEFKILSDGNLGALRVFIASTYKKPLVYEFEPVEVESGEYVVLHLRKLEEACKDEYGEDLSESGGTDSFPQARDFWIPGNDKLLHKSDAVYVLDQDDRVLDAVVFVINPGLAAWPLFSNQDFFPKVIEFLFSQGAWNSADGNIPVPSDAVNSSKTTPTQTICRDETTVENTRTKADWYITANKCATPGLPNDPKRL